MADYSREIAAAGGLLATHELYALGADRHELARLIRNRRIWRVRQGWFAAPGTHPTLIAAARVGGRATCTTGLALHGVWVTGDQLLQVACSEHDARLRQPRDSRTRLGTTGAARVHWRRLPSDGSRLILTPLESLRDAMGCLEPQQFAVSADSLLRLHPTVRTSWPDFCATAPARHRVLLSTVDGVCESGTETLTWLRLRGRSLPIRRQVPIAGIGRADFLVGERLVIEVDGAAYHSDVQQFEDDRRRDAALAARGMHVLRFSYRQVMERWTEVEAAIEARIRAGDHRMRHA